MVTALSASVKSRRYEPATWGSQRGGRMFEEEPRYEPATWASQRGGRMFEEHPCERHLREHAPELLRELEFFWTRQVENWTDRLDVAEQIDFQLSQVLDK